MDNPIARVLFVVSIISVVLLIIPSIFNWDWKARYFGCTALCIAGFCFLTIIPCFVLLLYGKAPHYVSIAILVVYVATHFLWCKKFIDIYGHIYVHEELRKIVYYEDMDAVYYLQRGDRFLLDEFYKFSQTPHSRYFVVFMALGFSLVPAMEHATEFTGLPFAHIFLIVGGLPFSWMCLGLAVRGYLIFYHIPAKLKKSTGKDVYVDLVSSNVPLSRSATELHENFINR